MKRLLLLRHAKSSWADADNADHERPLAKRGERDAPRIGARLRAHCGTPSLILTSSAERARRTAQIVARELGYAAQALAVEPALYLATPAKLCALVARQSDRHASLMLVGHNPGLTELANQLLPGFALDNLPTAGVIGIDFADDGWTTLHPAAARLAYYDYPKNPGRPLTS